MQPSFFYSFEITFFVNRALLKMSETNPYPDINTNPNLNLASSHQCGRVEGILKVPSVAAIVTMSDHGSQLGSTGVGLHGQKEDDGHLAISEGINVPSLHINIIGNIFRELPSNGPTKIKCKHL